MTEAATLTPSQRQFVIAMLTHRTAADAAAVAGIAERTAYRYLADPKVRTALAEAQDRLLREATQQAIGAMTLALSTLQDLVADEGTPPGVRVTAARTILEHARSLHEEHNLAERLARLEALLQERRA